MQFLPHLTHEGFLKQRTEKRHLYRAPFQNRSLSDPHVSGALKAERVSEGRPTRVFSRYFLKFLFLSWTCRQVFSMASLHPNEEKGGFSVFASQLFVQTWHLNRFNFMLSLNRVLCSPPVQVPSFLSVS